MDVTQIEKQFLDALSACGLSPHKLKGLISDGKIHRYQVQDDKSGSLNGWYVLHCDGNCPAGAFGSWKSGESHTWAAKSDSEFTPQEREEWRKKQAEIKRQREIEHAEVKKKAREKANYLWSKGADAKAVPPGYTADVPPAGVHPYLFKKGVKPYGLKVLKTGLMVPVRDSSASIIGLQFIQPDGQKRFITGSSKAGGYYAIGRPEFVLCVCEGFATGASIREATGYAVAVAFNSGNLLPVAKVLRDKFPALTIIICADNDVEKDNNVGLSEATEAARQTNAILAVAKFQDHDLIDGKRPSDFNDMHRLHGLSAVRVVIDAVLHKISADDIANLVPLTVPDKVDLMTRDEFELLVDDTDDFDELTDGLLKKLARQNFKRPAVEWLISKIAKKTGATKKSLMDEFVSMGKGGSSNTGSFSSECEVVGTLNRDHAILPMGGRVVIMNREYDPVLGRRLITFSAKSDFELRYCNQKIYDRGDELDWGTYWLNHPDRAQYKGMVFMPGDDATDYLNLWMGWGVKPGNGSCAEYLRFVAETICSNDDELYDYVINWCAHMVQRPQELPETALVFRGREGIGKNTFIDPLAAIVGQEHFLLLSSLNQVTGRFSGHLANSLLIFCNESVWGGDKSAQGVLKSMITDPVQPIEFKGRDLSMVKSFRRMIFATNEQWAVPRGADDRRYVITDVSDAYKGDWSYFSKIKSAMANGGTEALFQYLLDRDISHWHPRQIPGHILKRGWEMKIMSAGSVIRWWLDMLQQGYLLEQDSYSDDGRLLWPERCPFKDVIGSYLKYCNAYKINHPEHSSVVGRILIELGISTSRPRDKINNQARYLEYLLPPIDEAREIFSAKWGIPESFWASHDVGNAYA